MRFPDVRRAFYATATLVALSASGGLARGQDLSVSVQSVDRVVEDLGLVIEMIAPNAEAAKDLRRKAEQFQDPDGLKGIDRTRSLGMVVTLPKAEGEIPVLAAAIPITNLDDFLATVERAFRVKSQATDKIPGFSHLLIIPNRQNPAFVTSNEQYAFLSLVPAGADALKALRPKDWEPTHEDAGEISATIRIDRLPDAIIQPFLDGMKSRNATEQERRPDETEAHHRGRLLGMKGAQDAFATLLREGAAIHADLDFDAKAKNFRLDVNLSARPETDLAASLSQFAKRRSRFPSLSKDASMAVWMCMPVPATLRRLMTNIMDENRKPDAELTPEGEEDLKLIADRLVKGLKAEWIDLGMAVEVATPIKEGEPAKGRATSALAVDEGQELDRLLRSVAPGLILPPDAELRLDSAKASDGTPIHELKAPLKPNSRERFGDATTAFSLHDDLFVATFGEKSIAAIDPALAKIKETEAATEAERRAPVGVIIHAVKLGQLLSDNLPSEKALVNEIFAGEDPPRDRLELLVSGTEDGAVRMRLTGDLKAFNYLSRTKKSESR